MNQRIIHILLFGAALLSSTRAAIWLLGPNSFSEEQAKHPGSAENLALQMQSDLRHAIANAPDAKTKREYEFEYRLLLHLYTGQNMASLVKAKDGVDEFEAFVIAREYFGAVFGSCGSLALPQKEHGTWIVSISVGRLGPTGPSIEINSESGAVSCAGHPSVEDVESFMKHPVLMPNQSLEPMARSVTRPADAGRAPDPAMAHH